MVRPTFWLLNFSSQAAASAIPAIQVSEMTHSTAAPQAWRSFSVSSAAVAFAIFIVCSSSDSRTPMRRPSITGRIPIFGKLIFSLQIPHFIRKICSVSCRLRTETGKDKDDCEAECRDQFGSGDVARCITDKPHDRSDNTAANNGHNDEGRTVFGVLAEIFNAQREDCWVLNRHKGTA